MMRLLLAFLILCLASFLSGCKHLHQSTKPFPSSFQKGSSERLLSLSESHFPSKYRSEILVTKGGKITWRLWEFQLDQRVDKIQSEHKRKLTEKQYLELEKRFANIQWDEVDKKILGVFDGTWTKIDYQGSKFSLINPDIDTRERGLSDYRKFEKLLFELAGQQD